MVTEYHNYRNTIDKLQNDINSERIKYRTNILNYINSEIVKFFVNNPSIDLIIGEQIAFTYRDNIELHRLTFYSYTTDELYLKGSLDKYENYEIIGKMNLSEFLSDDEGVFEELSYATGNNIYHFDDLLSHLTDEDLINLFSNSFFCYATRDKMLTTINIQHNI